MRESSFIIKHKTAHTTMYMYCFKVLHTISIIELTVLLSETAIFLKILFMKGKDGQENMC